MATEAELIDGLRKADAAGNADDARVFANALRAMRTQPEPEPEAAPEPEEHGILGSLKSGVAASIRDFAKTKQTLSGETPEVEEDNSEEAQAPTFGDVLHPVTLAKKTAYMLGKGAPSIAVGVVGALAGAGAGSLVGPEGTVVGGVAGEVLGSGAASAAQELGPYYAAAVKEHPGDPEAAFSLALKQAATEGGITGASFGLFRFAPFKKQVADLLAQAFVVQPAVAVSGALTQSAVTGKPIDADQLAQTYTSAVVGTAAPLVGTHLAGKAVGMLRKKEVAPEPEGETKPAGGDGEQLELPLDGDLGIAPAAKDVPEAVRRSVEEADQPHFDFEDPNEPPTPRLTKAQTPPSGEAPQRL